MTEPHRVYRSRDTRLIAGVCGGLGEYLKVDPVIIRVIWAFATLISFGLGVLAYVAAWLLIPEEPSSSDGGGNAALVPNKTQEG